jgi:hypothetical protein
VTNVIEIFFSYAHEDEELMNAVRRQLVIFERNGCILKWHDRQIPAGAEWRKEIDRRLDRARIILLFVSPHFIESRYCYEVEGQAALRRHDTGAARVVPVILRPCFWQEAPFAKLQALPHDGKPLSQWKDQDEACLDVARGVMAIVDELIEEIDGRIGQPDRVSQHTSGTPGGGRGGNARVGGSGVAVGGLGGRGGAPGSGSGGDGGSAEVNGDGFAMGGEGGEAGQGDRGGRGGRGPLEVLGLPNQQLPDGRWLWDVGRGGGGAPSTKPDKIKGCGEDTKD